MLINNITNFKSRWKGEDMWLIFLVFAKLFCFIFPPELFLTFLLTSSLLCNCRLYSLNILFLLKKQCKKKKKAFLHENCTGVGSNPLKTYAHFQTILKLSINIIIYYSFRSQFQARHPNALFPWISVWTSLYRKSVNCSRVSASKGIRICLVIRYK